MDEFSRILEDYLDEEEINKKIENDRSKSVKKTSQNKNHKNEFYKTISISEFVYQYLGTDHDCTNLKHQGLKSFKNPYVVGVSNDFAHKNPDCIIRNEILVVIDSFGNPGTYINPNLLKDIETMEECKTTLKLLNKIKIYNFNDAKRLLSFHKAILLRIEELEKKYMESCDLLKILEKEKILFEIQKFARDIQNTNENIYDELLSIDNVLDLEFDLLFKTLHKEKKKPI